VWACVYVGCIMCVNFGNVRTCINCVLYCFVYVYVSLLVLSGLPPSDNSIAVNNNICGIMQYTQTEKLQQIDQI
jgi:hypothetical protein